MFYTEPHLADPNPSMLPTRDARGRGASLRAVLFLVCVAAQASAQVNWTMLGGGPIAEDDFKDYGNIRAEYQNPVAISADGARVAIGLPYRRAHGAGFVRVYELDADGSWSQLGQDLEGTGNNFFGASVSLSADGSRVAVGAPEHDLKTGRASVYEYFTDTPSGPRWELVGDHMVGESQGDQAGYDVSLSDDGNRLAVGSPGGDGNGCESGRVRVYAYSLAGWGYLGGAIDGVDAYDSSYAQDTCGYPTRVSVALSGDGTTLAMGSPHARPGYARVFQYDSTDPASGWFQIGGKLEIASSTYEQLGFDVALSRDGSRVAATAGAFGNQALGEARAYELTFDGGNESWSQMGDPIEYESLDTIYDYMSESSARVPISLSADGSRLAVGAPNKGNNRAGTVRVFKFASNAWQQVGETLEGDAIDDRLGKSVALSADGSRLAVSAPGVDVSFGGDAGDFRVYVAPCDASAPPSHGAVGNCTSAMPLGSSCRVTCDDRHTPSGETTCDEFGRLTPATCVTTQPPQTGGGGGGGMPQPNLPNPPATVNASESGGNDAASPPPSPPPPSPPRDLVLDDESSARGRKTSPVTSAASAALAATIAARSRLARFTD